MENISKHKRITLKKKFLRTTLITLFVALSVISTIIYIFTNKLLYDEFAVYIKDAQNDIIKNISLTINNVNLASVEIISDIKIYKTVNDVSLSYKEKGEKIRKQFKISVDDISIISEVLLVTNNGENFKLSDDEYIPIPDKTFLESIYNANSILKVGRVVQDKNGESLIMLGRRCKNFSTSQEIGYLIVYLKEKELVKQYNKILEDKGYSFLLSNTNKIMSHPDSKNVGKDLYGDIDFLKNVGNSIKINIDEKSMIAITMPFGDEFKNLGIDWNIVTLLDKKYVNQITRKFNVYIWLLEGLSALVALVLSVVTVSYILKPVTRLKNSMMRYDGHSKKEYRSKINTGGEIFELEQAYRDMVYRIDELIIKNDEEKEKQRELELVALQAQINPHFLYNTLDTIVWFAKIKKQHEIEKIALALAKFFRMSLHNGEKFITVREEITLVQSYITIEQIRFPNKLDVEFNLDDNILDLYILKLTLQPIVENALKHGIRGKNGEGKININGIKHGEYVVFEVIDNGDGFDMNKIDEIKSRHQNEGGGYGLKNVDQRLKLEYGEKLGVTLFSEKGIGTRVILRMRYK